MKIKIAGKAYRVKTIKSRRKPSPSDRNGDFGELRKRLARLIGPGRPPSIH